MLFEWLFGRRRRAARTALLAQPFPAAWLPILHRLPFYGRLDERGQQVLRDDLRVLLAEKDWEGCGGLVLTDEIKVTIAAQASLLLLNRKHEYFRDVGAILVYPSAYRTMPQTDRAGVVREGQGNLGEAWRTGPVVLAWDAARGGAHDANDGHNLVLHEFSHKLDMLDGLADGTPPIQDRGEYAEWVKTMSAEFKRLRDAAADGRATLLDQYGATNPAEFFAVATECFFEKSRQLLQQHAALYGVLRDYYQQDHAARG